MATTSLTGRRALVTGGARGFGAGMAEALADAGATVMIGDLRDDQGRETAEQLSKKGSTTVSFTSLDITDESSWESAVAATVAELGGFDILVNNAGVYPRVPMLEMREADWDYVMDVNLKAGFFAAQAAARLMVASGLQGTIINLSSRAAGGAVRGVHYSASKGGVVSMTRSMALELAPHRIRVNAIAPGLTDTAQPRYGNSEAELAAMSAALPLGRMAQPEEVADAAVFLASDAARMITGQTLHVNSGAYMVS